MKKLQWIFGGTASLAAVVILLITSFQAAMYVDFGVYQREYEKYEVLDDLGMEMDDVMYVTREMMAYLKGERDVLSVVTMVEGREQDFFNEQDRLHMEDVQVLFLGGLSLRRWASAVLAAALALLAFVCRKDMWKTLAGSFQATLGVLAVCILLLGIAVARDFNAVFTKFHEIFFDNDLWILDPATDLLINIVPEPFFVDTALYIGLIFAVALLGVLMASTVYCKRRKAFR